MLFLKSFLRSAVDFLKQTVVLTALAFVSGFAVARVLPPFIMDDPFWRDFWSGPPAAGIFAVVAAFFAYSAAVHSASVTKRNAEADEFWKQAEWALNLAISDSSTKRAVGLS
jgi:hypothetical protein